MALRNPCFKDQTGLICEGSKNGREREREEQRREEEEEKEDGEAKVWMLGFWFGTIWFCMDFLSRYMFVGCGL